MGECFRVFSNLELAYSPGLVESDRLMSNLLLQEQRQRLIPNQPLADELDTFKCLPQLRAPWLGRWKWIL